MSGDLFFHIAGQSEFSERRPWYIRDGLAYMNWNEFAFFDYANVIGLHSRVGRDFNLSNKVGINADVGLAAYLFKTDVDTDNSDSFGLSPVFSISLFYRIINK
ncbi:MAG: hypothetical protein PHG29_12770 [Prolixibacteraceae bacterium]|nr:hypothetical protein [Prolixibacteraceae bacterium]